MRMSTSGRMIRDSRVLLESAVIHSSLPEDLLALEPANGVQSNDVIISRSGKWPKLESGLAKDPLTVFTGEKIHLIPDHGEGLCISRFVQ